MVKQEYEQREPHTHKGQDMNIQLWKLRRDTASLRTMLWWTSTNIQILRFPIRMFKLTPLG